MIGAGHCRARGHVGCLRSRGRMRLRLEVVMVRCVPEADKGLAAQRTFRTKLLEVRMLEAPRAERVAVLQP